MFWGKLLTSHGRADTPNHRGGRWAGMQAKSCSFSLLMGRKAGRAEGIRRPRCTLVLQSREPWTQPRQSWGSPARSGHSEGLQVCHRGATCSLEPCHRSHQELCMGMGRQPRVTGGQLGSTETLWVHVDGAPYAHPGLPCCSHLGECPKAAARAQSQPVPGVLLSRAVLP